MYLVRVTETDYEGTSTPGKQKIIALTGRETGRIKSCTRSRRITSKLIPKGKSIS